MSFTLIFGWVAFPSPLSPTLFGGWVLPMFGETSKVEGTGSVPPLNLHLARNLWLPCSPWCLTIPSLAQDR